MKTIKIIDLLNKIANGEEVPKKIKINGYIYEYQGDDYLYINNDYHEYWLFGDCYNDKYLYLNNFLKAETEIIEEKKLPEKLEEKKLPEKLETYKENNEIFLENFCYKNIPIHKDSLNFNEQVILDKINEVLDYLESKEKGE